MSRELREQQNRLANAQLKLGGLPPDSPQYKSAQAEVERINSDIAKTQQELERIDGYIKGGGAYSGVNSGYSLDDFIAEFNKISQDEKRIMELRDKETNPQKRKIYDDKLAEIQQRKNEIKGILNPNNQSPYAPSRVPATPAPSSPNNTGNNSSNASLGSLFLGNAYGGNLTPGKKFGAKRPGNTKLGVKPHNHKGIDLEARHGSRITAPDILGEDIRVIDILNNPVGAGGLGCHVVLEGTVDGKRYTYILAHLAEGSIRVQPGDIIQPGDLIGQVGNTGNSSGPHLHFEVREGGAKGKPIDPERFFADYRARQTQAQPQPSAPSVMPEPTPTQPAPAPTQQIQIDTQPQSGDVAPQPTQDYAPSRQEQTRITWYNPKTRESIGDKDYENLLKRAMSGQIRGVKTEEDLKNLLRSQGYTYTDFSGVAQELGVTPGTFTPNDLNFIDIVNNQIARNRARQSTVNSNTAPETNAPSMPIASNGRFVLGPMNTQVWQSEEQPTSNNAPSIMAGLVSGDHSPVPAYTDEINGTTIAQNQEQMNKLNGINNSNHTFSWRNAPTEFFTRYLPPSYFASRYRDFMNRNLIETLPYTGPLYGTPEYYEYLRRNMVLL